MRAALIFTVAASACLAPGVASAQEEPVLDVRRARLRFAERRSDGAARHTLKLRAKAASTAQWRIFDPEFHDLAVTLGQRVVILHLRGPVDEEVSSRRRGKLVVKGNSPAGRFRLRLDPDSGRVDLRIDRGELSDLRTAGPAGVRIALTVGEEAVEQTVDLDGTVRRRTERWSLRGRTAGVGPPLALGPMRLLPSRAHDQSTLLSETVRIARTQEEWDALWRELDPAGVGFASKPTADFDTEMIVLVASGARHAEFGGQWFVNVIDPPRNLGAIVTLEIVELRHLSPVNPRLGGPGDVAPWFVFSTDRHPGPVVWTRKNQTIQ